MILCLIFLHISFVRCRIIKNNKIIVFNLNFQAELNNNNGYGPPSTLLWTSGGSLDPSLKTSAIFMCVEIERKREKKTLSKTVFFKYDFA